MLTASDDAALFMQKFAKNNKTFFPNSINFTCLAHAFNNITEKVELSYPFSVRFYEDRKSSSYKLPFCMNIRIYALQINQILKEVRVDVLSLV